MRTLIFCRMVVIKERLNERGQYTFVEWSCANKRNESVRTLIFGRMVVTKERLNERGSYIFVEWSCANKRNKSVGTLNSGQMVVHIASAKILENEGSISPSSFYGQPLDYQSHVFSLIYLVDEFLKEMRTWGQSKISSYCFCVQCESRESGGRGSSRFPCVTPVVENSSDRVTFRILSNMNDGTTVRKQQTGLTR